MLQQVVAQKMSAPISGNLSCNLAGKPWKGKVQSAVYSKKQDYITVGFEDSVSRMEITLRNIKKEISKYIPFKDEIQGKFKSGYDPGIIFFVRYFPDKKLANNYETSYTILGGGFGVDALDISKNTIKFAFEITCGRATKKYNPMKPDEKDLEKLEIKAAETNTVKFLSF